MKQSLLLFLCFVFFTDLHSQSSTTSSKSATSSTLPDAFLGEWNDECILDIEKSITIKRQSGILKATLKLGTVQVKAFSKIEVVTKNADGSFDCAVIASNKKHYLNIKLDNPKVILVKTKNEKKQVPLYSCKTINDQDEFDQLQEKYNK